MWSVLTDSEKSWRRDCRFNSQLHSSSNGPGTTFLYLMSVSVLFSYLILLVRCVLLGRLESQIVPLRKLLGAEKLHKPGVIDMQS